MDGTSIRRGFRQGSLLVAQGCGFWAISELGRAVVAHLKLPLPGNMVGMIILFLLLATGMVRLEWVEAAATLLLKHLAFFFIPIAVGLMSMGELLHAHGIEIVLVLLVSAGVGIVCAGMATQAIARLKQSGLPDTAASSPKSGSAR